MADHETKHERCPDCGLWIRCDDIEKHENGWHHRERMKTRKHVRLEDN